MGKDVRVEKEPACSNCNRFWLEERKGLREQIASVSRRLNPYLEGDNIKIKDYYLCLNCDEIIPMENLSYQKDICCSKCSSDVCQPLSKWIVSINYRDIELYEKSKDRHFYSSTKNIY